jgi:peptidoglycan/LPS O-acetylase OafA/YrhL
MTKSREGSGHKVGGLFEAGDGLRGMALLCIIVFHAAAPIALARGGFVGKELGWSKAFGTGGGDFFRALELWVYLFFSLSAFLLSRPYIAWIAGKRGRPDSVTFFKRRVFRIVPMFWATGIFVLIKYGRNGSSWQDVAHFFAFLQVYFPSNFSAPVAHGWSIDDEWLFYLLLPPTAFVSAFIYSRLSDRRVALGTVLALVFGVALAGYLVRNAGMDRGPMKLSSPLVQSPPGLLRAFVPGILMAIFEIGLSERLRGSRNLRLIGGAATLAGIALIFVAFHVGGIHADTQSSILAGSLIGLLVVGGALLVQIGGDGAVWWLWGNPVIRWYGERSYSIFLLHGVALYELRKISTHGAAGTAVVLYSAAAIAVLTVVGYFTYRFIEKPFMDYSHRGQRRKVEPLPSAD